MSKLKLYCILLFIIIYNQNANSNLIEIKVKVQNEIITNLDIINEKKYLFFLNPKLKELKNERTDNIAKNSLVNEIIKQKELEKYFDFKKNINLVNNVEKNLLKKKNIKNKEEFIKILKNEGLKYETINKKLIIETLWNQLIFNKYSNNIVINEEYLRKNILDQFNKRDKKFNYNLSEIVFTDTSDDKLDQKISDINKSIIEIGFENTANIFSVSNTSKNGGLIGWVNELQISKEINEKIKNLDIQEVSKPIKLQNTYLVIKINDREEINEKLNIESQLKKLVIKEENRQLNNFSIIFYKRLKKNIEINEY